MNQELQYIHSENQMKRACLTFKAKQLFRGILKSNNDLCILSEQS